MATANPYKARAAFPTLHLSPAEKLVDVIEKKGNLESETLNEDNLFEIGVVDRPLHRSPSEENAFLDIVPNGIFALIF